MLTTNQTPFFAFLLLLAACAGGSGDGGGGNSGGGDPGGGGEPPPEAPPAYPALFTTPHSLSGYQIEAGYGPYPPRATTGSVTEDSVRFDQLFLTSPTYLGSDGEFDMYSDSARVNLSRVYIGYYNYFQEYSLTSTYSKVLRAGENDSTYDYASFGYWSTIDYLTTFAYGTTITSWRDGYVSFGIEPGNIPATGTASYAGLWDGKFVVNGQAGGEITGTATFSADFETDKITGVLTVDSAAYGSHDVQMDEIAVDAGFADGPIIGAASTTMSYDGVMQELAGDVGGEFYGPAADELSGVFHIVTADGSLGAIGGFAARQ